MKTSIPDNLTGKDLFDFLIKNKSVLIAEKKYNIKHADAFSISGLCVNDNGEIVKATVPEGATKLKATLVINTTFWMDSHKDVHIDGLWKKSIQENKSMYLLQEHSLSFKGIITDEVKPYTQRLSWKSLGINVPGETEALVFDATIYADRNPYMFDQYRKGNVKNHSVGMRYVNLELAINDEDYKEEYAVWNKYFDRIANKAEAEETGYFWAVKEGKAIEGSAVPIGSNIVTPTLSVDTAKQPALATVEQPSLKAEKSVDWDKIANHLSQT